MTLLEQIKLNAGRGYDIEDDTYTTMCVALETETTLDACDGDPCLEFCYWLADNIEVVQIYGTTAVCKVSKTIMDHYDLFKKFCDHCNKERYKMDKADLDDNIETALLTLQGMIPGNYCEADYNYFMTLLRKENAA